VHAVLSCWQSCVHHSGSPACLQPPHSLVGRRARNYSLSIRGSPKMGGMTCEAGTAHSHLRACQCQHCSIKSLSRACRQALPPSPPPGVQPCRCAGRAAAEAWQKGVAAMPADPPKPETNVRMRDGFAEVLQSGATWEPAAGMENPVLLLARALDVLVPAANQHYLMQRIPGELARPRQPRENIALAICFRHVFVKGPCCGPRPGCAGARRLAPSTSPLQRIIRRCPRNPPGIPQ
jgi:hypothetical protein